LALCKVEEIREKRIKALENTIEPRIVDNGLVKEEIHIAWTCFSKERSLQVRTCPEWMRQYFSTITRNPFFNRDLYYPINQSFNVFGDEAEHKAEVDAERKR